MKILAMFTGHNSLGYENGRVYSLSVFFDKGGGLTITRNPSGGGHCPYGSLNAFRANWDVLSCSKELFDMTVQEISSSHKYASKSSTVGWR